MPHKSVLSLLLLLLCFVVTGCPNDAPPTLPPSTTGIGFSLHSSTITNGIPSIAAGIHLNGQWQKDLPGATGDPATFNVVTNFVGLAAAAGKRAPASWKITWRDPGMPCDGQSGVTDVTPGETVQAICTIITTGAPLVNVAASAYSFSPYPIFTDGSSGDTAVVSGPGFSSRYGMPLLQYFDLNGNFVAQTTVTAVAADGSWASAPVQDLTQVSQAGNYIGIVSNANASGGYNFLGTVSVAVRVVVLPPPPPSCDSGYCPDQP